MKKLAALLVLAGCTEHRDAIEGTQSLEVQLVSPASTGTPDTPLDDTARTLVVNVYAKDAQNERDPSFSATVQVYAQFLGTLTPSFGESPLAQFDVTGGVAENVSIALPNAFGPTVVWIDDGSGLGPDYVHGKITGTSPTLFYRQPFIHDLQEPRFETSLDALALSPLTDKQIQVDRSRHGSRGRLVVTSVFSQGYTVADVKCTDDSGTPPCVIDPAPVRVDDAGTLATVAGYDSVCVFSFSAPRDNFGRPVELGQVIGGFAGGMSEFLQQTEIGFPQTFAVVDGSGNPQHEVDVARIPAPVVVDPTTWFKGLNDPNGRINFERNEGGLLQTSGIVCDLDDDYANHQQWKIDPTGSGGDCSSNDNVINVNTAGISAIDPPSLVGKTMPRVVGALRPVFDTWIIFPRSDDDVDGN